ncbi:MAG TPA: LacI family DNA-binding transcriptional regulator [Cellulomonadaceae bacterium]|nr:LacI family DNA-binding transcriptional regulator [Cellulomonadaceae bacterium]
MAALLTDVAKRAGVSLATASRAFGEPDRVAAATRDRVLAAAAALGYVAPSNTAGRTFGVIVPDISNAVFAALVKSIQSQAWHGRHRMLLSDTNEEASRERELLTMSRGVDGVILCSPRLPAREIRELVGSTPMVVINREVDATTSLLLEADQGLRQAVEHLAALGHRVIAYVNGPASSWANDARRRSIEQAASSCGVEVVAVGNQAATVHGGLAAAASVAATPATAVIAYNDLVALGLRSGLRHLNIDCPGDMSVVGIDDLDVAAASEPELTSVRIAIEHGGSLGLELLLERISGRPPAQAVIRLESQLIVRRSTAIARTRNASLLDRPHP